MRITGKVFVLLAIAVSQGVMGYPTSENETMPIAVGDNGTTTVIPPKGNRQEEIAETVQTLEGVGALVGSILQGVAQIPLSADALIAPFRPQKQQAQQAKPQQGGQAGALKVNPQQQGQLLSLPNGQTVQVLQLPQQQQQARPQVVQLPAQAAQKPVAAPQPAPQTQATTPKDKDDGDDDDDDVEPSKRIKII